MQNRLKGLLRDTWWLWGLFLLLSLTFSVLIDPLFFVTLPVLVVAFVYYATMRYDDDGNDCGERR